MRHFVLVGWCSTAILVFSFLSGCGGSSSSGDSMDPAGPDNTTDIIDMTDPVVSIAVTSGFSGDLAFISADPAQGVGEGADGQGGIAIGSNIGLIRNADVTVFDLSDGSEIGSATTDDSGLVTVRAGAAFLNGISVEIRGNQSAEYYDVLQDSYLAYGPDRVLRAIVPQVISNIGVSYYTEAVVAALVQSNTADQNAAVSGLRGRRLREINAANVPLLVDAVNEHYALMDGIRIKHLAGLHLALGDAQEPRLPRQSDPLTTLNPNIPNAESRNTRSVRDIDLDGMTLAAAAYTNNLWKSDEFDSVLSFNVGAANDFALDLMFDGVATAGMSYPGVAATYDNAAFDAFIVGSYHALNDQIDATTGEINTFPIATGFHVVQGDSAEQLYQLLHLSNGALQSFPIQADGSPGDRANIGNALLLHRDPRARDVAFTPMDNPDSLALITPNDNDWTLDLPLSIQNGLAMATVDVDPSLSNPVTGFSKGANTAVIRTFDRLYAAGLDQGVRQFFANDIADFNGQFIAPIPPDLAFFNGGRVTDALLNSESGELLVLTDESGIAGTEAQRMIMSRNGIVSSDGLQFGIDAVFDATQFTLVLGAEYRPPGNWTDDLYLHNSEKVLLARNGTPTDTGNACAGDDSGSIVQISRNNEQIQTRSGSKFTSVTLGRSAIWALDYSDFNNDSTASSCGIFVNGTDGTNTFESTWTKIGSSNQGLVAFPQTLPLEIPVVLGETNSGSPEGQYTYPGLAGLILTPALLDAVDLLANKTTVNAADFQFQSAHENSLPGLFENDLEHNVVHIYINSTTGERIFKYLRDSIVVRVLYIDALGTSAPFRNASYTNISEFDLNNETNFINENGEYDIFNLLLQPSILNRNNIRSLVGVLPAAVDAGS